jgi:hypothetical protein
MQAEDRENKMAASLIVVLVVVAVLAVLAWPVTVILNKRRPAARRQPRAEHRRANVQGGSHVGGGRSVGPRRDAEVIPDEDPNEPTVPVRKEGTSPLDR